MFSYRRLSMAVRIDVNFKVSGKIGNIGIHLNFDLLEIVICVAKFFAVAPPFVIRTRLGVPPDFHFPRAAPGIVGYAAGASVASGVGAAYSNIAPALTIHVKLIDIPVGVVVAGQRKVYPRSHRGLRGRTFPARGCIEGDWLRGLPMTCGGSYHHYRHRYRAQPSRPRRSEDENGSHVCSVSESFNSI